MWEIPHKNDQTEGPSGLAVYNASHRKWTKTTQQGDVPEKKVKTVAPFEISPLNLTISTNLLGSSSYGCCYLALYRGIEVVRLIILHFHLIPQYKYELFHIYFTRFHCTGRNELNKLTLLPMCGFNSSVGRASHRYCGGHGFESR